MTVVKVGWTCCCRFCVHSFVMCFCFSNLLPAFSFAKGRLLVLLCDLTFQAVYRFLFYRRPVSLVCIQITYFYVPCRICLPLKQFWVYFFHSFQLSKNIVNQTQTFLKILDKNQYLLTIEFNILFYLPKYS